MHIIYRHNTHIKPLGTCLFINNLIQQILSSYNVTLRYRLFSSSGHYDSKNQLHEEKQASSGVTMAHTDNLMPE